MTCGHVAPLHIRTYRALLRLLPSDFRARHHAAMEDVFTEQYAVARREGVVSCGRLLMGEAWDIAGTGIALWAASGKSCIVKRGRGRANIMPTLGDDVCLAARSMLRHRGFFLLATITLALGIGATTAMYSALRAVVLDPLPFPAAERLVVPWRTMGTSGAMIGPEASDVRALRDEPALFDDVEEFASGAVTLTGATEPVRMQALKMTPGVPALLGTPPALGRTFTPDEVVGDGAQVMLLSHALWRSWFEGRSDVLGRTITAEGESWTIIGVMPVHAARPDGDARHVDLWLPLPENDWNRKPIARVADGVTLEAAAARTNAILSADAPAGFGGTIVPVLKPGPLHEHLRILMVAVTLLLLVACVNVSNLLLQRAAERRTEIAVRTALGASRARLVHQLLVESLMLAAAGALLGALFAWGGLRMLLALRPDELEVLRTVRIDGDVLQFCAGIAACAGVVLGLLPAARGSRAPALAALGRGARGGDRESGRARWLLVTAEVALSFTLLIGSALVVTSLRELASRDPGYDAAGLVAVDVRLPSWRYPQEPARAHVFELMLHSVSQHPAVRSVALATGVPPRMPGRFGRVRLDGGSRDSNPTRFHGAEIDSAFLATIGQAVIAGRGFERADATSPLNPVILAESTARRWFGGDAIGRRLSIEGGPDHTVIGVVGDIQPVGLADDTEDPLAYWPLQHARTRMSLAVRADGPTDQLLGDLHQAVRGIEPDAVIDVAPARELLGASLARERFTTTLLTMFSTLALILALVGMYGVLSQVVLSRTHEIGIRVALGASAARVSGLVMRSGLVAIAIGLAAGALLAAIGLRVLGSQLFGLGEPHARAYVIAGAVLLVGAVVAMLVPTIRAVRLDPARAIRTE